MEVVMRITVTARETDEDRDDLVEREIDDRSGEPETFTLDEGGDQWKSK
jgi:hypothetical protein